MNAILETVNVFLASSGIMLVLSLLVTAIVQAVQNMLALASSRDELLAELKLALSPLSESERADVIKDYEKLLQELHGKAAEDAVQQVQSLTGKLARFDITPWPHGFGFIKKPENIIGILITAAFLSFGAPFWYERLRELIQLRDALKPKEKKTDSPDQNTKPP